MCAFKTASPLIRETPEGQPLDSLEGVIERITFHNAENGYTVARLLPPNARDVITILGNFSNPVVGESLICYGTWTRHPQWGRQMQVARYEVVRPATAFAIEKYLGSGMVKGVGPVTAKRIVDKFGEEALDIIEHKPRKAVGRHRASARRCWRRSSRPGRTSAKSRTSCCSCSRTASRRPMPSRSTNLRQQGHRASSRRTPINWPSDI